MNAYRVTFTAAWTDRHGTTWITKGTQHIQADSRAAAILQVRATWPAGAEGTCYAEPEALVERVKAAQASGRPPSTWDDSFTWLQEWPTVDWLKQ